MKTIREFIDLVDDLNDSIHVEIDDNFDIELADLIIETTVIGFTDDGIIIEGDDDMLKILQDNSCDIESLTEAKYQGREVQLGKPMSGDVKKSKVYVRGPKGNVVKVNFGDKNMRIKKSNPARRKSFRARHKCQTPGPRWKAKYWSCRAW